MNSLLSARAFSSHVDFFFGCLFVSFVSLCKNQSRQLSLCLNSETELFYNNMYINVVASKFYRLEAADIANVALRISAPPSWLIMDCNS